jgi:pectate lyase
MPMPIDSAESALARVLAESGAVLPKRDAADLRVVDDVRNRTGKIIASQDEVGGWPPFALAEAAVIDTDQDGIPDGWEREHGLNPNDPDDAARTAPDGYTWLEKYLNELAAAR